MNAPIWVAWVVVGILAALSIIWIMGKGAIFIAGYNTSHREEKRLYDEKRLCRVLGGGFSILTIVMGISTFYEFELPSSIGWIFPWGLLGTIMGIAVLANTICWKKSPTSNE